MDENGKWVTLDNGVHVFIRDGESVEDAMSRTFDESDEHDVPKARFAGAKEYAEEIAKRIHTDFTGGPIFDRNHVKLSPIKWCRERVARAMQDKGFYNERIDDALAYMASQVAHFEMKDHGIAWYDFSNDRVSVNILNNSKREFSMTSVYCLGSAICHELGHALDRRMDGSYSAEFESSKIEGEPTMLSIWNGLRNSSPDEMKEIFSRGSKEMVDRMKDLNKRYRNGEMAQEEYNSTYDLLRNAWISIADCCQSMFGYEVAKDICGAAGHKKDYFDGRYNTVSECFAELTESIAYDRNATFYNFMKREIPDIVTIYEEIIDEFRKDNDL